jgi:hypothetical protein
MGDYSVVSAAGLRPNSHIDSADERGQGLESPPDSGPCALAEQSPERIGLTECLPTTYVAPIGWPLP